MSESWKGPEEDNISIGELAEWLMAIPENRRHLPVKVILGMRIIPLNISRMSFTDGERYFAEGLLKGRSTFEGIYLEINGE